MSTPRYPRIRVKVRSSNPLVLVSAVRQALRQAGVDPNEIRRFSEEAFESAENRNLAQLCREWATVEAPLSGASAS